MVKTVLSLAVHGSLLRLTRERRERDLRLRERAVVWFALTPHTLPPGGRPHPLFNWLQWRSRGSRSDA
ncbi:hypothetical protein L249_3049 [Ophiocordyceps polyrhachis-furcata BCC 54312]|uniref:Uncharacterized protein n=1 Tax=Ophiocordyceps polyrhachis-furcata BCC 54312 TaxID=1330021 RepID=A0A367LNL7_9HYPO|nr:hypothetical protein L249_3049 [Ophiocordyceps polyrhachis-furcata BCC 54312]